MDFLITFLLHLYIITCGLKLSKFPLKGKEKCINEGFGEFLFTIRQPPDGVNPIIILP